MSNTRKYFSEVYLVKDVTLATLTNFGFKIKIKYLWAALPGGYPTLFTRHEEIILNDVTITSKTIALLKSLLRQCIISQILIYTLRTDPRCYGNKWTTICSVSNEYYFNLYMQMQHIEYVTNVVKQK